VAEGTIYTTTYLPSTATGYTSTINATGYSSGTIIYGVPSAGYQTITTTRGAVSSTTTLASPSGSSSGTVEVFVPMQTFTSTTFVASTAPASTQTIAASDSSSGEVLYYQPSAGYQTTTTTFGGQSSTTTIAQPSQASSGTVEGMSDKLHILMVPYLHYLKYLFLLAQPRKAATSRQQLRRLLPRSAQTRATKVQSSTTSQVQGTKPPLQLSAGTLRPPRLRNHRTVLVAQLRSSLLKGPLQSLASSAQAPQRRLLRYLHRVPILARSSTMSHRLLQSTLRSPAVVKPTPQRWRLETDHPQALWKL